MEEKLKLSFVHLKFFTLIFSVVFSYFVGLFVLFVGSFFPPSTPIFLPILPRMSPYWDNSKPRPGFVGCPKQMKISQRSQENEFPLCQLLALGVKECTEHTLASKTLTAASCPLCASVVLSLLSVCV